MKMTNSRYFNYFVLYLNEFDILQSRKDKQLAEENENSES